MAVISRPAAGSAVICPPDPERPVAPTAAPVPESPVASRVPLNSLRTPVPTSSNRKRLRRQQRQGSGRRPVAKPPERIELSLGCFLRKDAWPGKAQVHGYLTLAPWSGGGSGLFGGAVSDRGAGTWPTNPKVQVAISNHARSPFDRSAGKAPLDRTTGAFVSEFSSLALLLASGFFAAFPPALMARHMETSGLRPLPPQIAPPEFRTRVFR